jgi:hypothetical protein
MDGVQPKRFVGETKVDGVEKVDNVETNNRVEAVSEGAPKKARKRKHRKFIDLQKQPPKPKPLLQE